MFRALLASTNVLIDILKHLQTLQVVGMTTSGCYSYTLKKSICFAYLPITMTEIGNQVYVELLGNRYLATVTMEPLVESEPSRRKKAAKST